MIPVKCPSCGLQWNVREDSPESVTCPMCLATVPKPPVPRFQKVEPLPIRPLPALPLEVEVQRDAKIGGIGACIVIALLAVGLIAMVMSPPLRNRPERLVLTAMGLVFFAALALVIIRARFGSSRSVDVVTTMLSAGCMAGITTV